MSVTSTGASVALEIDADGLEIDAGALEIDAGGLEIDADGLEIDADGLKIDAVSLEIDARALEIDAVGLFGVPAGLKWVSAPWATLLARRQATFSVCSPILPPGRVSRQPCPEGPPVPPSLLPHGLRQKIFQKF